MTRVSPAKSSSSHEGRLQLVLNSKSTLCVLNLQNKTMFLTIFPIRLIFINFYTLLYFYYVAYIPFVLNSGWFLL